MLFGVAEAEMETKAAIHETGTTSVGTELNSKVNYDKTQKWQLKRRETLKN